MIVVSFTLRPRWLAWIRFRLYTIKVTADGHELVPQSHDKSTSGRVELSYRAWAGWVNVAPPDDEIDMTP